MQYINIPANTTFPLVLGDDINAMNTAKIYLLCDTSSGVGAINILLPKITIPAGGSIKNWWFEIFVNDIGNNASVNNIKITPSPISGGDKINGSASQITLNTNGVTGRIVITGTTSWDFNIGSSSSGGGDTFESGQFTLSANGTNAQIGMNGNPLAPVFPKVKFDVADPSKGNVGDTILNDSNGAGGMVLDKSGSTFTIILVNSIGSWNNGDTVKFSSTDPLTTTISNNPVWILTIPTAKKLKLGFLKSSNDDGFGIGTSGISNGVIQNMYNGIDNTNCINIRSGTFPDLDGWEGLITLINNNSFDITFTKFFAGLDITGQLHLIEQ